MLDSIARVAQKYWTDEKIRNTISPKRMHFSPQKDAQLIFCLDLLNKDGSMSRRQIKKFLQINHMFGIFLPMLEELIERHSQRGVELVLVDIGAGNSYLSLLVAYYLKNTKNLKFKLIAVERNPVYAENSRAKSANLGLDPNFVVVQSLATSEVVCDAIMKATSVESGEHQARVHMLWALHACDQATDAAIKIGIDLKADFVAVAPCCQNELNLKMTHRAMQVDELGRQLWPLFKHPQIRREVAAHFTDAMRALHLERCGYQVSITEFVEAAHTPKNRLIMAKRVGNYHRPAEQEIQKLTQALPFLALNIFESCENQKKLLS